MDKINLEITKEEATLLLQGLDSLKINKYVFPKEALIERKLVSMLLRELDSLRIETKYNDKVFPIG